MEAENSTAKSKLISLLRKSEKYTKTDMVYFVKNTWWVNANTLIVTFLSFVLYLLFAKYVPKDVYGNYQFLISISSIIGALTLTGMNTAVTQAVSRGYENIYLRSIRTQLTLSVIPSIIGACISVYYFYQNNNTLSLAIIIIAILLPVTNALNTWGAYLTGKKLFKQIFYYSQINNILYYGSLIVSIIWFPTAIILITTNIIFGLISNYLIYRLSIKKYPPNKLDDEATIDYGTKLSVSNILPFVAMQLDNVIVFHFLGATNLAIYTFASNIPDKFISLLRPIPSIAFPKLAQKNAAELSSGITQKLIRLFAIAMMAGVVYFLFAPYIYNYFFPQYEDAVRFSQLYVLVPIVSLLASFSTTALFASRSPKIFYTNIINPVFGILLLVIGGYLYGIWGIIVARIVSSLFNVFTTSISLKMSTKFD